LDQRVVAFEHGFLPPDASAGHQPMNGDSVDLAVQSVAAKFSTSARDRRSMIGSLHSRQKVSSARATHTQAVIETTSEVEGASVEAPAAVATGDDRHADPFNDVVAAVTGASITRLDRSVPLPPSGRFRVRVARVGKPHRPTKRNYDYFDDLNAALAARREAEQS
jgi:hypothetical protein